MGTDISGYIEVRPAFQGGPDLSWVGAIDLDLLYDGRSYDEFGCLFGVRNFAGFAPVAADRGAPEGMSAQARADYEAWTRHDLTWIAGPRSPPST